MDEIKSIFECVRLARQKAICVAVYFFSAAEYELIPVTEIKAFAHDIKKRFTTKIIDDLNSIKSSAKVLSESVEKITVGNVVLKSFFYHAN